MKTIKLIELISIIGYTQNLEDHITINLYNPNPDLTEKEFIDIPITINHIAYYHDYPVENIYTDDDKIEISIIKPEKE